MMLRTVVFCCCVVCCLSISCYSGDRWKQRNTWCDPGEEDEDGRYCTISTVVEPQQTPSSVSMACGKTNPCEQIGANKCIQREENGVKRRHCCCDTDDCNAVNGDFGVKTLICYQGNKTVNEEIECKEDHLCVNKTVQTDGETKVSRGCAKVEVCETKQLVDTCSTETAAGRTKKLCCCSTERCNGEHDVKITKTSTTTLKPTKAQSTSRKSSQGQTTWVMSSSSTATQASKTSDSETQTSSRHQSSTTAVTTNKERSTTSKPDNKGPKLMVSLVLFAATGLAFI